MINEKMIECDGAIAWTSGAPLNIAKTFTRYTCALKDINMAMSHVGILSQVALYSIRSVILYWHTVAS